MIQKLKPHATSNTKRLQLLFATLTCLAASTISANSDVSISKNLFLHRAFSANTSRELLMEGHIEATDFDGFFSFFSCTGAYQHSWNQSASEGIGAFPFWSGTNVMTVGTNLSNSSLDAYQFGLGTVTTDGSIELDPIVYQGGADFLLFFGASTNDPGVFLKLKAPLGIIGVNPQLTEVAATAAATYPAGAIQVSTSDITVPATTMQQAFAGNLTGGQDKNGDFLPMEFGLIDGTQLSGAQFGDIEMALGYNFICDEDYLFGIALRACAPSANKPTGEFLLEPIFGRGGSWGIGGYIDGKAKLWEDHANKSLTLNVMGTILHLVKTTSTIRSYDVTTNGAGSKYLLVADYNANVYQGVIQNLINLSTLDSNSSFSAEGDASISLTYVSNGWAADLGYNFWGRTQEILSISGTFPTNRYAILGRQSVGAYNAAAPATSSTLCQPSATISSSEAAVALAGNTGATTTILAATTPANRISGNSAFDLAAAQQLSASTSKIFAKVSYSCLESHFSPHLGLAGEFEISTSANNALPQWSVALIGGMYF
ncbi:MAG: hypothetical protein Q8Q60_00010 [Candidatus Chromulinivorax sp.]|nr:hypothetical protein [Candidatus Chromulinivorax sp.]